MHQLRVWSLKMAIFASSVTVFRMFLHTWPRQLSRDVTVDDLGDISRSLDYFTFTSNFSRTVRDTARYCRLLIENHTLAFDWCHFWWPWSILEGHFRLDCHFHVHFSNLWQAFTSLSNNWACEFYHFSYWFTHTHTHTRVCDRRTDLSQRLCYAKHHAGNECFMCCMLLCILQTFVMHSQSGAK